MSALLLLALVGCTCQPDGSPAAAGKPDEGKWFRRPALSEEDQALVEQLEAIGYASGTREGSGRSGVVLHDAERSVGGLVFYTSGHAPAAYLRDREGREIHRWERGFRWSFPLSTTGSGHGATQAWRRAKLRDDGTVVAIHEGLGIVAIDAASDLVWASENGAHHDLVLADDGGVVHLAREAHPVDGFDKPVLEDFVVWLDAEGRELRRVSVLAALEDSRWSDWLTPRRRERGGDLLHTNTLEVLGPEAVAAHPAFTEGRLLLSFRTLSALAVLDPDTGGLVWALRGPFRKQHDPTVTSDGRLLVFDNDGLGRGVSRVLEVHPETGAARWQWPPEGAPPLGSHTLGAVTELPEQHLLVTESEGGRAFELAADGTAVWEWHSPHRAGAEDQFVAALFEVHRTRWLQPPPWASAKR